MRCQELGFPSPLLAEAFEEVSRARSHILLRATPMYDMLKLRHARHTGRETSHDTKRIDWDTC